MPMEMSPEPYIPLSPALQVTLRSDPVDLDSPFRREILHELQQEDKIGFDDVPVESQEAVREMLRLVEAGPDFAIMEGMKERYVDPRVPTKREMAEDLKLEVPLSPPDTEERLKPWQKRVSFAKLEELTTELPMLDVCTQGTVDESTDQEMMKLADDAAKDIEQQLRSEKIEAPELTARLDVPIMKPVDVASPWERPSKAAAHEYLEGTIGGGRRIQPLEIDSKDDLKLNWAPISAKSSRLSLDEIIEDKVGYLVKVTAKAKDIIRSAQMLWKPKRLRLFENEDYSDDEDIEEDQSLLQVPLQYPQPQEPMRQVPQKRAHLPSQAPRVPALSMPPPSSPVHLQTRIPNALSTSAFSTGFSASSSLESFLRTRGSLLKKQKLISDHSAKTKPTMVDEIECTQEPVDPRNMEGPHVPSQVQVPVTPLLPAASALTALPSPKPANLTAVHLPSFQPLKSPRTIILNNALLRTHRAVVSFLESHAVDSDAEEGSSAGRDQKQLRIIYRELDVSANSSNLTTSSHAPPDIIFNPTTCLILTTVQALAQRALPGQMVVSRSMVQDRVLGLAAEYDFVLLLVSHILTPSPGDSSELFRGMTTSDSMTYNGFVSFCASLADVASVKPALVPVELQPGTSSYDVLPPGMRNGTKKQEPDALQSWIWSLIAQHAFPTIRRPSCLGEGLTSLAILQDETLWSLFLQRCGLNPFASQVVLSALQGQKGTSEGSLRRFVQMSRAERMAMFSGQEMIGRRALERASQVLNGVWGL